MLLSSLAILLFGYLIGSIPFGLIVVKIATGRDVRRIESGRTGGTNAMRAAGLLAGIVTAVLDISKGLVAGLIALWLMPGHTWLQVFGALLAVLGHNYSIFLAERDSQTGKLRLRGGAGGAPAFGGALALWPSSWMIILPLAVIVFLFVGYASLTTISVTVSTTMVFLWRAWLGLSPWSYVVYGILATMIVVWALRPNLERLKQGTERLVGLRAYLKKKASHLSHSDAQQQQSS